MRQQFLFKLDQGPHGSGLRCDTGGLFLGSQPLLLRDADGNFEARAESDLRKVFSDIYGDESEWESRIRSVKVVAIALNKGDMARAMMAAVLMRLPDPDGQIRIPDVDGTLAKAGFNPDEPRDERVRWTTGGEIEIVEHDSARYPIGVELADGTRVASKIPELAAIEREAFIILPSELPAGFDTRLPIGKFEFPENLIPGTRDLGDYAHDQIGKLLQNATGRDVDLSLNTVPNVHGIDVKVPQKYVADVGTRSDGS